MACRFPAMRALALSVALALLLHNKVDSWAEVSRLPHNQIEVSVQTEAAAAPAPPAPPPPVQKPVPAASYRRFVPPKSRFRRASRRLPEPVPKRGARSSRRCKLQCPITILISKLNKPTFEPISTPDSRADRAIPPASALRRGAVGLCRDATARRRVSACARRDVDPRRSGANNGFSGHYHPCRRRHLQARRSTCLPLRSISADKLAGS